MKQSIDPENYEKNKGQGEHFSPCKGKLNRFKGRPGGIWECERERSGVERRERVSGRLARVGGKVGGLESQCS